MTFLLYYCCKNNYILMTFFTILLLHFDMVNCGKTNCVFWASTTLDSSDFFVMSTKYF